MLAGIAKALLQYLTDVKSARRVDEVRNQDSLTIRHDMVAKVYRATVAKSPGTVRICWTRWLGAGESVADWAS